jgi:hypothetical protein
MIVVWTPIEIAGKWGLFREPWLLIKPEALLVFFGGLAIGTWGLWRVQRRPPTPINAQGELVTAPVYPVREPKSSTIGPRAVA